MDALHARFEALFSISTELSSALQLEEVLQHVVAQACRLMEARVSSLLLIDKEAGTLHPAATYGTSVDYLALPDREIDASLTGEVIKTGWPLYIPDVREETWYRGVDVARREGLCTLLTVPLRSKTDVIGVLTFYTGEPRCFDESDLRLMTRLATQSAIAIENAPLHRDEMEARERLRQSEKLAALGKLSAGLAHELPNPLNTVSMLIYAMARELPPDGPLGAALHIVQGELRRMLPRIEQFLDFARATTPLLAGTSRGDHGRSPPPAQAGGAYPRRHGL
jgi:signal transduction protein with GAF and PtsI domain